MEAESGPSVLEDAGAPLGLRRRVHISSVTLEHLKGSYKVEPGDGQSRDSYLKEHGVVTFLVINPKVGHIPLSLPFHSFILFSPSQLCTFLHALSQSALTGRSMRDSVWT